MSDDKNTTSPGDPPSGSADWVKFDEADAGTPKGSPTKSSPAKHRGSSGSSSSGVSSARGSVNSVTAAAVISTEPQGVLPVSEIQVVDEHSLRKKNSMASGSASMENARDLQSSHVSDSMDNVNLSDDGTLIRGKRFHNGEVIVTLLPVNDSLPWVTPAKFRPELVPEELMAPVLTLTVEEYVQTMEKLTKDMRFTIFNICYKRILVIWIVTAFVILLSLLFSGFKGIELFACGVAWLILNAGAIFFCMWIKIKLNKQMEQCMSSINQTLLKHNLLLGVDDRGKLSCHKVNLCYIYFEAGECIKKLQALLAEKPETNSNGEAAFDREAYLRTVENFEDVEVVVAGRNSVRIDRRQERAEKLFLHYIQRWAKDYLRRRLDWVVDDLYGRTEYTSNTNPRHMRSALCPCQYIEEHLRNKRQRESLNPCAVSANPCYWCD